MVLLLDLRDAASLRSTLECKLQVGHREHRHTKPPARVCVCVSAAPSGVGRAPGHVPGQERLMLSDGVQLVGGRVTSLAWQLSLGVFTRTGARDVDVATTEVAAALQGRGGRARPAADGDAWGQEVLVLQEHPSRNPDGHIPLRVI